MWGCGGISDVEGVAERDRALPLRSAVRVFRGGAKVLKAVN